MFSFKFKIKKLILLFLNIIRSTDYRLCIESVTLSELSQKNELDEYISYEPFLLHASIKKHDCWIFYYALANIIEDFYENKVVDLRNMAFKDIEDDLNKIKDRLLSGSILLQEETENSIIDKESKEELDKYTKTWVNSIWKKIEEIKKQNPLKSEQEVTSSKFGDLKIIEQEELKLFKNLVFVWFPEEMEIFVTKKFSPVYEKIEELYKKQVIESWRSEDDMEKFNSFLESMLTHMDENRDDNVYEISLFVRKKAIIPDKSEYTRHNSESSIFKHQHNFIENRNDDFFILRIRKFPQLAGKINIIISQLIKNKNLNQRIAFVEIHEDEYNRFKKSKYFTAIITRLNRHFKNDIKSNDGEKNTPFKLIQGLEPVETLPIYENKVLSSEINEIIVNPKNKTELTDQNVKNPTILSPENRDKEEEEEEEEDKKKIKKKLNKVPVVKYVSDESDENTFS